MQSVWPTPIKLLGQPELSFSCVKFGSHSVGFHSRIIEKKLVLAFMAAFCHLPFHAIKHWSCCPRWSSLHWFISCEMWNYDLSLLFSFFYQLDCVMCSHQKCPCEHSNFSRQLINLYCLKKSSQVEGTKSDYDILCVFAPLCARVCVCVNSVHGSLSCAFYYTYTERRHFRSKKIKSLFKIPKTTRDEK